MTVIRSNIHARLDRLPWSRWHWRVVIALGVAWVLDGLEVTLVGSIGGVLERADTLALSATQIGWSGSLYIGGAVIGAQIFGRMADRLGRKKLFLITLSVYMFATLATGVSPDFSFFAVCRFVTGLGIGGEYAAIDYVERIGMDNIARYEHDLLAYATHGLRSIPGLRLIGTAKDKASVLSFVLEGYQTEEVGKALNWEGIAVRSGHHCAQPILRRFGVEATVCPSLAFYNTCEEVDRLVAVVARLAAQRKVGARY